MALSVNNLCGLLTRSRLLAPEAVRALAQRWQTVAVDPASPEDFVRWLVAQEQLTAHQAELLSEGRVESLFLDQYKILERIGKGRMAGVYKAVHPQQGTVAVKVLPPSKARVPEMLARFQREARLALQLSHSGIVRSLGYGECRGLHYLVMEYLEGETLEEVLRQRGKLLPREAARLGFLTTLGLQHIDEQRLVHRDLKPANLMLCPAPGPYENTLRSGMKILDVGLGRELFDPDERQVSEELTADGALLGTPDYLAPEQARDPRRADIRADLYSLGCVLYRSLAGQTPFADDNLVRQVLRHATQEPQPVQELNPQVPPALGRIVSTLLAKDPAGRYQTPAQAADALRAFLAGGTPSR